MCIRDSFAREPFDFICKAELNSALRQGFASGKTLVCARGAPRCAGPPTPADALPPPRKSGRQSGLATLQVLAGAGVDLDLVAGVDEQGHLDLSASLQGGGLGHVGGRVTAEAGIGLGDLQLQMCIRDRF